MFTFFSSFAAKVLLYLFLTLGIIGSATAVYFSVVHNAKQIQLLQDENGKLRDAMAEQNVAIQQSKDLIDQNNTSINNLDQNINNIHNSFNSLNADLDKETDNTPASSLFKKIIEELSKGKI